MSKDLRYIGQVSFARFPLRLSSTYTPEVDITNHPCHNNLAMYTLQSIRIRRIVASASEIQNEIQSQRRMLPTHKNHYLKPTSPFLPIFKNIQSKANHISAELERKGGTAANLPVRSRRAYQWLAFLGKPDPFCTHLQTLHDLYQMEKACPRPPFLSGKKPSIRLFHISPLFRFRVQNGTLNLTAGESFIGTEPRILRSLIQLCYQDNEKQAKKVVYDFTRGNPYTEIREKLEYLAIPLNATTKGEHKDLLPVFHHINKTYFGDTLNQPHLVWSDRKTFRKFGHYQFETDSIMISRSLDDPDLPTYALGYVMYHELLHKKLGYRLVNGRRYSHTKSFRKREKEFEEYNKAQAVLEHLSRKYS
ncbi:MAG: hypothetical protein KGY39_00220 [Anaerolineales bacterium]|nr:hypothetical protein [Anaerolineales bacterium]